MKKLATFFGAFLIASVVLTSCGGGTSACDCAEVGLDMMTDAFSGEYTEDEIESKYKSKMEKCDELVKDEAFEKELQECMEILMSDYDESGESLLE